MNKTNIFISILLELQKEPLIIKNMMVKAFVLKTKALSPSQIKYDQIVNLSYMNSDLLQLKKSEILTAAERIENEVLLRQEIIKYIYKIIDYADKEYQLHIINIYLDNKWNIYKEAEKYNLDRREFAKQIKLQLDKIINQDETVWNNLVNYFEILNDERYLKIIKNGQC